MKIIKVNKINLVEKDNIEIEEYNDFKMIHQDIFASTTPAYDLDGILYLIGIEVFFTYIKNKEK